MEEIRENLGFCKLGNTSTPNKVNEIEIIDIEHPIKDTSSVLQTLLRSVNWFVRLKQKNAIRETDKNFHLSTIHGEVSIVCLGDQGDVSVG